MSTINVFCLPFAGGSAYSYYQYKKNNRRENVAIIPIDLPGRGSRANERLLDNIEDLCNDVFLQISRKLSTPYAIYGHSMGSLLGYLLVKKIIDHGLPEPVHLFFTGRKGPSIPSRESPLHLMHEDALVEELKVLGGIPTEIIEDRTLFRFFEPVLRADFKAVETYVYSATEPFDVPITVCYGRDERFTDEEILAWQRETRAWVDKIEFPGGHFFIFEYSREVVQVMTDRLLNIPIV